MGVKKNVYNSFNSDQEEQIVDKGIASFLLNKEKLTANNASTKGSKAIKIQKPPSHSIKGFQKFHNNFTIL